MTGDELIAVLQALPAEERALEVYKYNGDCECGNFAHAKGIEVTEEENAPYEKSDNPWQWMTKLEGKKLLYI